MLQIPGSRIPHWLFHVIVAGVLPAAIVLGVHACSPAQLQTVSTFASAVEALAQLVQAVEEADTPEEAAQALDNAPEVLGDIRVALEAMCGPGGTLPPDHKVCQHFAAYEADPRPGP